MRSSGAGAGHWHRFVTLTNQSSKTCTIYGYADFGILDGANKPLPSKVVHGKTVGLDDPGPKLITLPAGAAAWTDVSGDSTPAGGPGCVAAAHLTITPPDNTKPFTLPFPVTVCSNGAMATIAFQAGNGP